MLKFKSKSKVRSKFKLKEFSFEDFIYSKIPDLFRDDFRCENFKCLRSKQENGVQNNQNENNPLNNNSNQ